MRFVASRVEPLSLWNCIRRHGFIWSHAQKTPPQSYGPDSSLSTMRIMQKRTDDATRDLYADTEAKRVRIEDR